MKINKNAKILASSKNFGILNLSVRPHRQRQFHVESQLFNSINTLCFVDDHLFQTQLLW